MNKFGNILAVLFVTYCFSSITYAQVLDDEETPNVITQSQEPVGQTDDEAADDELFEELFSEYSDLDKDVTKVKTFDDVITRAADEAKTLQAPDDSSFVMLQKLPPLEGDMLIGITKDSFKVYRDMAGRTKCKFSVTLQSNLDRSIKALGLNLVYPKSSFAFIFREVPANGKQVRYITTVENICYAMAGVPDIDIHKCKIRGATGAECAKRLKWSDNME